MGLLSPFQRKTSPAAPQAGDEVQRARTRARQRLIGAVVLLGIGIVGFPLLFETHPRPIPVDLPISIANKDKVAPLALPPARTPQTAASDVPPGARAASASAAAAVITEAASDAGREVVAAPQTALAPQPARKAEVAPLPARAEAKAPAAREESHSAPAGEARFVLQVGAYAEASSAREARQRVEKLGLKTYTQVVETSAGSRIRVRVGPFGSRDEADRAAGKLKSAGLPVALLTL
jgi:DedD protein